MKMKSTDLISLVEKPWTSSEQKIVTVRVQKQNSGSPKLDEERLKTFIGRGNVNFSNTVYVCPHLITENGEILFNAREEDIRPLTIDMMEKCSAKEDMLNKMKNKSYDELISNMVDKMTKNVNKYPANSEMHTKGELAIKSMKALAEIAKESVSPDIETQKKVATHMAVIINYDPSLMNKTELTYAYHQGGEKKRMTSAMDIVTFLTDVHVNEGLKEPVKNNINEKTAQKTAQKTQIKSANMK